MGVDVARFKSEFLADYWARHGTPVKARMLGHIHELSRWATRMAPLSNWMARSAPGRWLNEQLINIDDLPEAPDAKVSIREAFQVDTDPPAPGGGEQGALVATAKITCAAETIDDKYYAAAQVGDNIAIRATRRSHRSRAPA